MRDDAGVTASKTRRGQLRDARRVLFICVENSNRSQMAEAFARMHGGQAVVAASAGSRPSGKVNPRAVAMMAERGYDLTTHRSKSVSDLRPEHWDWVITMGCGDDCPVVQAGHHDDWPLPDPRDLDDADARAVRDEVERRVLALLGAEGIVPRPNRSTPHPSAPR